MTKAKYVMTHCVALMISTGIAQAYEVDTHERLSEAEHNSSIIATYSNLLSAHHDLER